MYKLYITKKPGHKTYLGKFKSVNSCTRFVSEYVNDYNAGILAFADNDVDERLILNDEDPMSCSLSWLEYDEPVYVDAHAHIEKQLIEYSVARTYVWAWDSLSTHIRRKDNTHRKNILCGEKVIFSWEEV